MDYIRNTVEIATVYVKELKSNHFKRNSEPLFLGLEATEWKYSPA